MTVNSLTHVMGLGEELTEGRPADDRSCGRPHRSAGRSGWSGPPSRRSHAKGAAEPRRRWPRSRPPPTGGRSQASPRLPVRSWLRLWPLLVGPESREPASAGRHPLPGLPVPQPWRRSQVSTEMATASGCSGRRAWPASGTSTIETLPPSSLASWRMLSVETSRSSEGRTIRVSTVPPDPQTSVGVRCRASDWGGGQHPVPAVDPHDGVVAGGEEASATASSAPRSTAPGRTCARWAVAGSGLGGSGPGWPAGPCCGRARDSGWRWPEPPGRRSRGRPGPPGRRRGPGRRPPRLGQVGKGQAGQPVGRARPAAGLGSQRPVAGGGQPIGQVDEIAGTAPERRQQDDRRPLAGDLHPQRPGRPPPRSSADSPTAPRGHGPGRRTTPARPPCRPSRPRRSPQQPAEEPERIDQPGTDRGTDVVAARVSRYSWGTPMSNRQRCSSSVPCWTCSRSSVPASR